MRKAIIIIFAALGLSSCFGSGSGRVSGRFSDQEAELIREADSIMRVLTIEDSLDLAVLRSGCSDLSAEALLSEDFASMAGLMTATVTHPSQDGVGIAGPQVGLKRRVVAVQRFDKVGEPFEVYPNVRIVWASDSLVAGPEGCLSVPGRRADVLRSQEIVIEYTDMAGLGSRAAGMSPRDIRRHFRNSPLPVIQDTVSGFTAVIFQHEIDHLDGILYIDRLTTQP